MTAPEMLKTSMTLTKKKLLDFFKKNKYTVTMRVGDLVRIDDNQDGLRGTFAVVTQILLFTGEVVVQCVQDNTPWIYYLNQLTLLSEVKK